MPSVVHSALKSDPLISTIHSSGRNPSKHWLFSSDEEYISELNIITGVTAENEPYLDGTDSLNTASNLLGGERTSIMKTITNLWTGNPANFLPLEYPISSSEHFFPESLIQVKEEEP